MTTKEYDEAMAEFLTDTRDLWLKVDEDTKIKAVAALLANEGFRVLPVDYDGLSTLNFVGGYYYSTVTLDFWPTHVDITGVSTGVTINAGAIHYHAPNGYLDYIVWYAGAVMASLACIAHL